MVSSSPAGSGSSFSPSASYFVRLGKLSSKVRERALEQSLSRARNARAATHTAVTQISSTLDLLENARTTLVTANQQLGGAPEQLMQRWKEWQQTQQQQQGQPQEGQGQGAQAEQSMEVDETKDHGEVPCVPLFSICLKSSLGLASSFIQKNLVHYHCDPREICSSLHASFCPEHPNYFSLLLVNQKY